MDVDASERDNELELILRKQAIDDLFNEEPAEQPTPKQRKQEADKQGDHSNTEQQK